MHVSKVDDTAEEPKVVGDILCEGTLPPPDVLDVDGVDPVVNPDTVEFKGE